MVIAVRISSAADTDEIRSTRVSVAGAAVSCCSILRKMQERRVQRVEIENENIGGTAFEIHTTSNVDYRGYSSGAGILLMGERDLRHVDPCLDLLT